MLIFTTKLSEDLNQFFRTQKKDYL